ncbi:MAG: hypothetical protein ACE5IK_02580 [Acidobacteriota bacterium]
MNSTPPATWVGGRRAAAGVALLAVALRLPWLGRVGLTGDEDISTLAARGILAAGWPRLPSGHGYWRGPIYHYLIAPLVASGIDWLPRLVSVAAAAVTAYLLVRLGRHWVGDGGALAGALLFSLSLFEIDLARQVRMYSLYQLVALLAVAAAVQAWRAPGVRTLVRGAGLVFIATQIHLLGATLAVIFLPAALRERRRSVGVLAVGLVVFFIVVVQIQGAVTQTSFMAGLPPVIETEAAGAVSPVRAAVFGRDRFELGQQTLGMAGLLVAGLLAGVGLGGVGLAATRHRPAFFRLVAGAGLAVATAATAMHQIGLGFALLVLLILLREELFPGGRGRRALRIAGGTMAGIAMVWVATALLTGHGAGEVAFGLFGRRLGRFVRFFVSWPPAIAGFALLAAGLITVRAWSGTARAGERLMLVLLLLVTIVRSLLASKWQDRYLADLWPLWELLAGWGVAAVLTWGWRHQRSRRQRRALRAAVVAAALVPVVGLPGTSLPVTLRYLARGPGAPPAGTARVAGFAPDFRGVARWLQPRLADGEPILATDWLSTYCYLDRVDGWIRSAGYGGQSIRLHGSVRDIYLHARVLPDVASIESFSRGRTTWIIAGGGEWTDDVKLSAPVREWLDRLVPEFIARDGRTRIYRLEPTDPVRVERPG